MVMLHLAQMPDRKGEMLQHFVKCLTSIDTQMQNLFSEQCLITRYRLHVRRDFFVHCFAFAQLHQCELFEANFSTFALSFMKVFALIVDSC